MYNRDEAITPDWNKLSIPNAKQVREFELHEYKKLLVQFNKISINPKIDSDEIVSLFYRISSKNPEIKLMFMTWLDRHRDPQKYGSFDYREILQFLTSLIERLERQAERSNKY